MIKRYCIRPIVSLFQSLLNPRSSEKKRKISLLRCQIHGSHYYGTIDRVRLGQVTKGMPLILGREPDNEYDAHAVEIFTSGEVKLGYVPKNHNLVIATLLDAHEDLSASVIHVDSHAWEPVTIEIVLHV